MLQHVCFSGTTGWDGGCARCTLHVAGGMLHGRHGRRMSMRREQDEQHAHHTSGSFAGSVDKDGRPGTGSTVRAVGLSGAAIGAGSG